MVGARVRWFRASSLFVATAVVVAIVLFYIGSSRIGLGVRALTQSVEGAALVRADL